MPLTFVQAAWAQDATPASFRMLVNGEIPVASLPPVDPAPLLEQDAQNLADGRPGPWRFGVAVDVDLGLETAGIWNKTSTGGRIWRLQISSAGAYALGFHFDQFDLAAGAELYVYDPLGSSVLGPYTQADQLHGALTVPLLQGSDAVIELYQPPLAGTSLVHLASVSHAYRDPFGASSTRDFGDSASCEINVNCSPEGTGWDKQRDSVARILVKDSSGVGWCSGALINNMAKDGKPYLLTAYHCGEEGTGGITSASNLNQWVFYFNYQGSGCANPSTEPSSNTVTGAILRAAAPDSDFLLLELNTSLATLQGYGAYYAGWNSDGGAATSTVGIHHPSGDVKKISTDNQAPATTGWNGAGVTHWAVSWDATTNGHGITEGGSSGSPLFDQNQLIVGQLHGGSSFCATPSAGDLYGKFSHSWDQNSAGNLKDWLDPANSGLTQLEGSYDPPSQDYVAKVQEIVVPTTCFLDATPQISPEVTLLNKGAEVLTSVDLTGTITGGASSSLSWTGNLASQASTTVTLPAIPVSAGSRTLSVTASNPNGAANTLAHSLSRTVDIRVISAQQSPLLFNFEDQTLPPTGWTIFNPDNDYTWTLDTSVSGFGVGSASAVIDNYTFNLTGTQDGLMMDPTYIDLRSASAPAQLQFDVAYTPYDATLSDRLVVYLTTACNEGSFQAVYDKEGLNLSTTGAYSKERFVPSASQWRTETIDLDAYLGKAVAAWFVNNGGYGNPLYLDNISLVAASPTYSVTVTGGANGSVSADSGAISACTDTSGSCMDSYQQGTSVTLTATPQPGYTTSWSGTDAASCAENVCTFNNLSADKAVTVSFALNQYTVTPSAGSGGNISPDQPQLLGHGSVAHFTITPDAGLVAQVAGTCGGSLSGADYTTNAITAPCTVQASFFTSLCAPTQQIAAPSHSRNERVQAETTLNAGSGVEIPSGLEVHYEAGSRISLAPAFHAANGSSFTARILPVQCATP